ncbi:antibiotic biosynthesis monooxygenase [Shewanella olleyana]|uniref:putative quinol monooxygenase n=1 Tax=Shewanella olleyana TaxID=135626 RepID=UPI00200EABE8|nr:antibiotic biosynthesis monooxygenase [Shewanella olleyana]MCL1067537.1 antibiotic biosynthesis monooxygenase [Shewanella olleyana]
MLNQIVKFTVKPEYQAEFKAALLANKQGTASEAGNIEMKLFVDNQNPNVFFAFERWENQAAIEHHMAMPYTSAMIALFENSLEKPLELFNLGETTPLPVALKPANPEDDVFVILFIFKINPDMRQQLLTQFEEHITQTRKEPGNLLFDLYTVEDDDSTIAVYEHWRKESDVWDIHFNQPYSKVTGALMEQAVIGDMNQYMNFVTEISH